MNRYINICPIINRYTVTSTYVLLSTATPLHKHVSLLSPVTRLNQHMSYYQPLRRYINLCPIINRYIVTSTCPVINRYINICPIINSYTLTSTCLVINRYTVTSTYVISSTFSPLRIISCFKIATVRSCTACVGKLFRDGLVSKYSGLLGPRGIGKIKYMYRIRKRLHELIYYHNTCVVV
jgi:hypothetical protein